MTTHQKDSIILLLSMNTFDLSPAEHLRGPEAAAAYDRALLEKLAREREWVLAKKGRLGKLATRCAAMFYRGDLGMNTWQTDRVKRWLQAHESAL